MERLSESPSVSPSNAEPSCSIDEQRDGPSTGLQLSSDCDVAENILLDPVISRGFPGVLGSDRSITVDNVHGDEESDSFSAPDWLIAARSSMSINSSEFRTRGCLTSADCWDVAGAALLGLCRGVGVILMGCS